MNKIISMKDTCIRLLTPRETLDRTLFDEHNKMYPEIRKQLFEQADFVVKKTIAGIPGLKVHDICLNGSSASYFYEDNSDIDVKIEVHNDGCNFLTKKDEDLIRFMGYIKTALLPNHKVRLNNRFVDLKLNSFQFEIMGLYSVLHDKWVIEPKKDIVSHLDADELMEEYTKRYYIIKNHLNEITQSGEILTLKGIKNLEKYYTDIYLTGISDVREFIIFKMLKYRGVLKDIQKIFVENLKKNLTIE